MTFSQYVRDVAERALVTFVVAVLAIAGTVATTDFDPVTFARAAGTAGLVALAAFLKTLAWPQAGFGLSPVQDVAARATFSAVQAGAIVIAADAGFQWYTASAWEVVVVAAFGALVSVVKGALALRMAKPTVTPASFAKAA